MEAKPQRVEIYETTSGKSPFKTWLRSLRDQKAKQKIRARIARVRLGNFGDQGPSAKESSSCVFAMGQVIGSTWGEKGMR